MRCWSMCSLKVLRVSMVCVKSGVHLTVWSEVLLVGLAHQLSLPWGHTWQLRKGFSRFLPHPWSSAAWSLLTAGSSIGRLLGPPGDVLKVKVNAQALLRSRLIGPVPGVLPGFLSCHTYCFSAAKRPKRRNFERDLYKMALKIAPAEKFLLYVQPELCQAIEERSCTNSNICTWDFFHLWDRNLFLVKELIKIEIMLLIDRKF